MDGKTQDQSLVGSHLEEGVLAYSFGIQHSEEVQQLVDLYNCSVGGLTNALDKSFW